MRSRIAWLLAVVLTIPMVGCAGRINKTMDSWRGAHVSQLIGSWGPPAQIMDDGLGGKVFIYATTRTWTTPGTATTQTTGSATATAWGTDTYATGSATGRSTSTTTYTPAQTHGYHAYRMFYINANGVIYNWAWKGL
jgi:hypothetical protein